jgi:hypothetical protein
LAIVCRTLFLASGSGKFRKTLWQEDLVVAVDFDRAEAVASGRVVRAEIVPVVVALVVVVPVVAVTAVALVVVALVAVAPSHLQSLTKSKASR